MNQKFLTGSIVTRFLFFAINFYFTIEVVSTFGWNFIAILLASFATRDLVQGIRLVQVVYFIQKNSDQNNENDKK